MRISSSRRLNTVHILQRSCCVDSIVIMSRRPGKSARAGDYIETETGNKVSKKCTLNNTQAIMLGGKTVIQADVTIRGDLVRTVTSTPAPASNTAVQLGRYCFVAKGAVLRPPGRMHKGVFTYMPLRLGDHVFIGQDTVVQAASVASHVSIGKDCVIGEFVIIKEYVKVLEGTVIAPFTVIPSFSIVAGSPGRVIAEMPEGQHEELEFRELYKTVGNKPEPPA